MQHAVELELILLRNQLAELSEKNCQLNTEKEGLEKANRDLEKKNTDLQSEIAWLKHQLFGRRSEKATRQEQPGYSLFEDELSQEAIAEIESSLAADDDVEEITIRRRRRRGPKPLPANLPREDRVVDLDDGERSCDHGHERIKIDEKITEELELIPGRMKVIRYIQPVYETPECYHPDCRKTISEPMPWRPIEDGRAGTGLLAHVVVSKYGDHQPLYRQSQIFEREGLYLPRSTLCGWILQVAALLAPIVAEMKRQLLAQDLLQADETTIRVRVEEGETKKVRLAYLWGYGIPTAEVVYDFSLDRSQRNPVRFLDGYEGALQIDGYDGYNGLFREGKVHRLGCFAHLRRKVYKAVKVDSSNEARTVLAAIQKLYRIERKMKEDGYTAEERAEERQRTAKPILAKLKELLLVYRNLVLPKSLLGKAITYALNEWTFLERYVDVGKAEIDNNSLEQTLRPVALGRKNYLFAGSPAGGHAAAVLYSLVTSCKRLGINPWEYLKDVLERISTHPSSKVAELTPRGWQESRASSSVS